MFIIYNFNFHKDNNLYLIDKKEEELFLYKSGLPPLEIISKLNLKKGVIYTNTLEIIIIIFNI